jgi:hypothetical protein
MEVSCICGTSKCSHPNPKRKRGERKGKKHKRKPLWPEQTMAMDLGEVTVA